MPEQEKVPEPPYVPPATKIEFFEQRRRVTIIGGGMEVHAIENETPLVENLAGQCALLMSECHRLRWIVSQLDNRIGGTVAREMSKLTHPNLEVVKVNPQLAEPQPATREEGEAI